MSKFGEFELIDLIRRANKKINNFIQAYLNIRQMTRATQVHELYILYLTEVLHYFSIKMFHVKIYIETTIVPEDREK